MQGFAMEDFMNLVPQSSNFHAWADDAQVSHETDPRMCLAMCHSLIRDSKKGMIVAYWYSRSLGSLGIPWDSKEAR